MFWKFTTGKTSSREKTYKVTSLQQAKLALTPHSPLDLAGSGFDRVTGSSRRECGTEQKQEQSVGEAPW